MEFSSGIGPGTCSTCGTYSYYLQCHNCGNGSSENLWILSGDSYWGWDYRHTCGICNGTNKATVEKTCTTHNLSGDHYYCTIHDYVGTSSTCIHCEHGEGEPHPMPALSLSVTATATSTTTATITASCPTSGTLTYTLVINGKTQTSNTGKFNVTGLTEATTYPYTVTVTNGTDTGSITGGLTTWCSGSGSTHYASYCSGGYEGGTCGTCGGTGECPNPFDVVENQPSHDCLAHTWETYYGSCSTCGQTTEGTWCMSCGYGPNTYSHYSGCGGCGGTGIQGTATTCSTHGLWGTHYYCDTHGYAGTHYNCTYCTQHGISGPHAI